MSTASNRLNWPFAAAWTAVTFVIWLTLVIRPPTTLTSLAWLLLAAVFAQFVTLMWRLPWISTQPDPENESPAEPNGPGDTAHGVTDHELSWVLCWTSQLYWLGCLWLGPSPAIAAAASLGCLLMEWSLLPWAPPAWPATLPDWLKPIRPTAAMAEKHGDRREANQPLALAEPTEENIENQSATFARIAEDGLSVLHGWWRFELAPGQKSQAITIGFFPPFLTTPEFELDLEGEHDIAYEIEHLTPAGVRVNLKRRQAADTAVGKLLWHASTSTRESDLVSY